MSKGILHLNKKMKKALLVLSLLLTFIQSYAQQGNDVEMATGLRSSGKIYVVVLVMCLIFIGFIVYLFSIDRRVKKMEKNQ
jgi:hypothetical protein